MRITRNTDSNTEWGKKGEREKKQNNENQQSIEIKKHHSTDKYRKRERKREIGEKQTKLDEERERGLTHLLQQSDCVAHVEGCLDGVDCGFDFELDVESPEQQPCV